MTNSRPAVSNGWKLHQDHNKWKSQEQDTTLPEYFAEFKTLDEVIIAVFQGKTVCWKQDNYIVADWGSQTNQGHKENLVIKCTYNGHGVGLFYADNINSDYNATDFYTLKENK